ncbi:hypothetical protein Novomoskovsk_7 [Bacillus phage Novomoskovsk]|uniref:Uncharacterized protein n=1 Tax=Bacillus phage Novomoskovsk TaxID=2736258 RepID=A0A6M9Z791_9CAUD|nr:hypothetical protein Novomoskovsk_7 [Bacillus phage Novomoskovsk]
MKQVNVSSLLNGESCYGHSREDLERYGVPAYSVMIHEDDISHYRNLPYTEYIKPKARFHSLMSLNNVDKATTVKFKDSWYTDQNPPIDKDYWWKVNKR